MTNKKLTSPQLRLKEVLTPIVKNIINEAPIGMMHHDLEIDMVQTIDKLLKIIQRKNSKAVPEFKTLVDKFYDDFDNLYTKYGITRFNKR
jgi:hypothetical protein